MVGPGAMLATLDRASNTVLVLRQDCQVPRFGFVALRDARVVNDPDQGDITVALNRVLGGNW